MAENNQEERAEVSTSASDDGEGANLAERADEAPARAQDASPERDEGASAPSKESAATPPRKSPETQSKAVAPSGIWTPTNIALLLAIGGLGAFWKATLLFKSEGHDFYSGSAWLFLISFVLVTLSAYHFLDRRLRIRKRREAGSPKPADDKPGADGETAAPVSQSSFAEALVPALPFLAIYSVVWWMAWDTWSVMYAGRSWQWMFGIALVLVSYGVYYALKPPSEEDEKAKRMPTRRLIMLVMLPFVVVYGMIWLAERLPNLPK